MMRKLLTITLTIMLAAILALGMALPGLAADENAAPQTDHRPPRPRIVKGIVDSIDGNGEFFVVKMGDRLVEIDVNEGTKYFTGAIPPRLRSLLRHRGALGQPRGQEEGQAAMRPIVPVRPQGPGRALLRRGRRDLRSPDSASGENQLLAPNLAPAGLRGGVPGHWQRFLKWLRQFGHEASFDDLEVGGRVAALVVPRHGGPLAKLVLIVKPSLQHRVVGTVSDVTEIGDTGGTIAIDTENDTVVLTYDSHTIFTLRGTPSLKIGMKAMAVYVEEDSNLLAKMVRAGVPPPEPAE